MTFPMTRKSAKELGAFYTPQTMADLISEWAIDSPNVRVLEPSAGHGALVTAGLRQAVRRWGNDAAVQFLACDIDSTAIKVLQEKISSYHELKIVDFLELRPDDVQPVHVVLTNPPFTRNHDLSVARRAALRERFDISGAAGLWVPFLSHACSFLLPGGRLAAIIPASSTFTRYGRQALSALCAQFSAVEIRQIADRPSWSADADERGAILLAAGYRVGSSSIPTPSRWHSAGVRLASPNSCLPYAFREGLEATDRLGEIARITIGAVTGDNRTFLLSEAERAQFEISESDLKPIVSRSRHAAGLNVSRQDLRLLARRGEKTWLLAPTDIEKTRPGVRRRLAAIPPSRRKKTLWLNKRTPWWKVNAEQDCDAVFTYMNHQGPRLVLCDSGITCSNTLHHITFNECTRAEKIVAAISMLGTVAQLTAETTGRAYGGGVLKFELSEARNLPVFKEDIMPAREIVQNIETALRSGDPNLARAISDRLILPKIFGRSWRSAAAEMDRELAYLRAGRHQLAVCASL